MQLFLGPQPEGVEMKQSHLIPSLAFIVSLLACSGNDSEPEDSGKGNATGGESGQVETGDTGEVSASQWCEENGCVPDRNRFLDAQLRSAVPTSRHWRGTFRKLDGRQYLFVNHEIYDYAAQL